MYGPSHLERGRIVDVHLSLRVHPQITPDPLVQRRDGVSDGPGPGRAARGLVGWGADNLMKPTILKMNTDIN